MVASEEPARGALWRNVKGALHLAWQAAPRQLLSVCIFSGTPAVLATVQIWLGKELVDAIAQQLSHASAPRSLMPLALAMAFVTVASHLASTLAATRQELLGLRVNLEATRRFLAKSAEVDLGSYDDPAWHDRMQRAQIGLNFRPLQLTSQTISFGAALLTLLGMSGVLLSLHPLLLVLTFLAAVPGLVAQRRANRDLYADAFEWTANDRERQYVRSLASTPEMASELRAFGTGAHLIERFRALSEDEYQRKRRLYRRAERVYGLGGLISGSMIALCYVFVANWGAAGRLSPGSVTALIGALASVATQINAMSASMANIEQHATFLHDYYEFLALPRLLELAEPAQPLPAVLDDGVRFEGVRFKYPTGTTFALDGLSLHIRGGEMLALVGDNGSGKSTLVKLLERFYDPTEGHVLVGGVDLRVVDPTELRSRTGVLFQDFVKYLLTARDNVIFGRIDQPGDDTSVWRSLEAARATDIVKALQRGLDNHVGRLFEGGQELSGGQWQRLALARLFHRRADIWILDEPTSSLDPEAESAIFAELRAQLNGRIGIVISHRFSTVRIADRIAVLSAGRVVELGTHEELVALGGRYAELFEVQAAGYR